MRLSQQQLAPFLVGAIALSSASSSQPLVGEVDAAVTRDVQYDVPTFHIQELLQPTRQGEKDLHDILTTSGLLAIRVPVANDQYTKVHHLKQLCQCQDSLDKIKGGRQVTLTDEMTVRSTIATATMGSDYPLPLPEHDIRSMCGSHVLDALMQTREVVSHVVTKAFVPAVDRFVSSSRNVLLEDVNEKQRPILDVKGRQGYTTMTDIVRDGTHLEHFHVYSKHSSHDHPTNPTPTDDSSSSVVDEALDWHTDAGLFLAFLPGQSCNDDDNTDESFRVSIPSYHNGHLMTQEQRAIFPTANENEVIIAIMLGTGAQHWLNMPHDLSFKATKHAIKMMENSARVWYGMMHLVPLDAIVHKSASESFTFSEMKKSYGINSLNNKITDSGNDMGPTDITIGCGEVSSSELLGNTHASETGPNTMIERRRLHGADGPEDCNGEDSFFCWFSCLPSPSISVERDEKLEGGDSLYCLDEEVLLDTNDVELAVDACTNEFNGVVGQVESITCVPIWAEARDDITSLLKGKQLKNYTDDSQTETNKQHQHHNMNNDEERKYCYGSTSMLMSGYEWESFTCIVFLFSSWVITSRGLMAVACIGTILAGVVVEGVIKQRRSLLSNIENPVTKLSVSAMLYGVQLTLGYFLMLLIMTYSGPLNIAVILGLVVGHVIWNYKNVIGTKVVSQMIMQIQKRLTWKVVHHAVKMIYQQRKKR